MALAREEALGSVELRSKVLRRDSKVALEKVNLSPSPAEPVVGAAGAPPVGRDGATGVIPGTTLPSNLFSTKRG